MDKVIAMDIGGTKTLIAVVDQTGEVLASRRFPTDIRLTMEEHLDKCMRAALECMVKLGLDQSQIVGIGVTVPGLADPNQGKLILAPYSGWKDVAVADVLNSFWPGIPVSIDNDVNACALAELMFSREEKHESFLWMTVSTGIGGGIVVDGEILRGEHLIAGEIGHVIVEWENGRRCGCGNAGCLEAHASGTAITQMAVERCRQDQELAAYFAERNAEIDARHLAEAARLKIAGAVDIYHKAGQYIGRALSYAVNILNPGCIYIGGGVSLSLDLLIPGIQETFQSAVISDSNRNIPILSTALGYEAGLMGAASLAFRKIKK